MMILQNWQSVYIHIERRELKAGHDANGNNVVEGDANNRSNVCMASGVSLSVIMHEKVSLFGTYYVSLHIHN